MTNLKESDSLIFHDRGGTRMLFTTTQEHEEFRAKVRGFAETKIKLIAFMLDKENKFPDEQVKEMGELGWMGIPFPKEYGGAGLDYISYAIAVEELARVDGGAGVILSAHVSLGSYPIFAFGTEEQKRKYLVPLASGKKIGAFGLTEPNAGSDAGETETTAEFDGTGSSTGTRFSSPMQEKPIRMWCSPSPNRGKELGASVLSSWKKVCPASPSGTIMTNWGSVPPLRQN